MLANKKSTILARIVAIGRMVLGKYILVSRPELAISEEAAELRELENRFQGSRATNKNMEYGILEVALVGTFKMIAKA